MIDLWPVAAIFVAGFLTEVGYVGYVRSVTAGCAWRASLWCSVLVALGLAATYLCVQATWFLVLPAMAGHSIGTYWAVRHGQAKVRG